ncbi:MAG: ATP synthase F0 subunit B [Tissierellia bacterium]|nr:ATP synthase F0 subunit B [Tissierellia bacterium]
MNGVPLNINWQQILLHFFNFTILALGLYLLIYEPVVKFMEKRTDYFRSLDEQAQAALQEAEKQQVLRQEELDSLHAELDHMTEVAMKEVQGQVKKRMDLATEQSDRILADAKENAMIEREKILHEAKEEVKRMIIDLSEKIVTEEGDIYDDFLAAAGKGEGNE